MTVLSGVRAPDLLLSRKALAAGVGLTTRRNKVLPSWRVYLSIPPRIGVGKPKMDKPTPEQFSDRGFIFSLHNASIGVLAGKYAPGFIVVQRDVLIGALATYAVAAFKTVLGPFARNWNDVYRFDKHHYPYPNGPTSLPNGKTAFRINGLFTNPTGQHYVTPYNTVSAPILINPAGDPAVYSASSTLCTPYRSGLDFGLVTFNASGTEASRLKFDTAYFNGGATGTEQAITAGEPAQMAGGSILFWARNGQIDSGMPTSMPKKVMYGWSKISSTGGVLSQTPPVRVTLPAIAWIDADYYGGFPHPLSNGTVVSERDDVTGIKTNTWNVPQADSVHDTAYAYVGSGIDMSLHASLSAAWTYITKESYELNGISFEGHGSSRTIVDLTSIALKPLYHMDYTYTRDDNRNAHSAFAVSTVDYLYADIEEQVFITLELTANYTESLIGCNPGFPDPGDIRIYSSNLTLQWVVSVRGTKYTYTVDTSAPRANFYARAPDRGGYGLYPGESNEFLIEKGIRPSAAFNPLFTGQGGCPFIAYTTKAEEAAGQTPEFYLDMSVTAVNQGPMTADVAAGYVYDYLWFAPPRLIHVFLLNFALVDLLSGSYNQNRTLWSSWFATPTRLQVCNGVKGPWTAALGSGFENNPKINITRI